MSQTKPTHQSEKDPVARTGVYQATSAGLAHYIKRAKMAGLPLSHGGRELGYVLCEVDALADRCERLEAVVAELADKLESLTTKRTKGG